jgi:hypothetical protein
MGISLWACTIAIELTRRWMEKRQKRILNQNGMQALSPTHGVNIVVGYFTRQQPRDYEFAMHRSITAGKLADFVVLSDDLHTVDREKIKDVKIVRTVVGGKTVYQA